MKLVQLFKCMRGKHERSRGQARQDGDIFRSQCRGCGKGMIRHRGGWILDPAEAPEKSPTI